MNNNNNNCNCKYFFITSCVSFIAGLFFSYTKIKKLKKDLNSIEKKLKYIEYTMHINDNYQIRHDKHHLLLSERITNLEKEKLTIVPQNLAPEIESEYIQEFDNPITNIHDIPVISSNSSNNLIGATKKLIFG